MQDERKTKKQLVRELRTLRAKLKRLEKSDDDTIGGVQIISHDISESKRAEEALRTSEERYRTLFETMDEGFCVVEMLHDPDGKAVDYRFVEINSAFERQTGLQQALGKTIRQMVPNHDAHWFEIYGKVARTGEAIRFENPATAMQRYYDVFAFRIGGDGSERVGVLFNDITERKREAEALRISEERFRIALENSPIVVFNQDRELRYTWVYNPHVGFDQQAVLGKTDAELLPADDAARLAEIKRRVLDTGVAAREEVKTTIGGQSFFYDLTVEPLRDLSGDIIGVTCASLDITERKRVEEVLSKTRDDLKRTLDLVPDMICTANPDGFFLNVNPAFTNTLGYSQEQLLATSYLDLIHPDDRESTMVEVERQLAGQPTVNFENRYRCKNDTYKVLEWNATRAYSGVLFAVARDITERKRVEEVLRESEESYRSLFENMLNGFAYCRMIFEESRPQDLLYLVVNKAFERLTGLEDVVGRKITEVIPGIKEANPELLEIYGRVALTGKPEQFEDYFEPLKAWLFISVYSPAKGFIVAVFDNITERKRAEASIIQALEWQEAIFEGSRDAVFISDQDSRLVAVNKAAIELTGYSREQLLTMRIPDLHDQRDLDAYKSYHQRIFGGEEILSNAKILRSDCTKVDTEFNNRCVSLAGKPYMHTTARDITERKRAERLIEEERNMLRSIINAIPDEIVVKDLERKFVLANEGCLRALGKNTMDEVVGLRDEDLVPEPFVRDAREKEIHVLTSGETLLNDMPEPRRNPTTGELERAIMSTKTPLHDPSGRLVGLVVVNRDITNLHRTQETLSQSETRFRTVWDHSLDANRLTDAEGTIVMVNQSYCQLFKKESEELVGRSLADTYLPKPDENIVGDYCERFRNRTIAPFLEAGVTTWNGEALWLELSNSFLFVPNQQELLLTVFRDITKRKRAEEKLRESEEKFRTIFENNSSALAIIERDTTISMVNKEYCKMGLYEEKDVIGTSWTRQIPPEDLERLKEYNRKRLIDPKSAPDHYEFAFYRKDGEIRNSLMSVAVIPTNQKIVCSFTDITDRKRAEEALRQSEEKFRLAFDTSPDSIAITRLADGVIVSVNKGFKQISGYTQEEVIGKTSPEINSWKDPEDRREFVEELQSKGEVRNYEVPLLTRSGEISGLMSASIIDLNGEPHVLVITRDITERKRAEEDLKQTLEWQGAIFEGSRDAIFISDEDSHFILVNNAAIGLTGYSREQLLGMRIPDLHDHPDMDAYKIYHQRILGGEEILSEAKILREDGSKVETEFSNGRLSIAGRLYMHTTARDITERKRADLNLRESEVRFRELFNRMSSGVAVYEAIDSGGDFIFRDFNPAAERIEKVSRKDILGKRVSEAFPGVKEFGVFEVFQRVWQTGKPEYFPESIYKDERDPGSWRENSVFKLPTGEIVSIYNDITERKRAEESLRKQDERYKRVIENIFTFIPEGILVFTDTLRLFNRNKTFDDIVRMYSAKLGYTEQELTELIFGEVKNKLAGEAGATIRIPKKKNEEREHRTDHSIKDP